MIPTTNIPQISRDLIHLSIQIGQQLTYFLMPPALEIRPDGSAASLEELGTGYIDSLAIVLAELSTTQQTFQRLMRQIAELHSTGHPICLDAFIPQSGEIQTPLVHIVFKANCVVESLIERVDLLFQDALTQLKNYREIRKTEQWARFCLASKQLRYWTIILIVGDRSKGFTSFLEKSGWPLTAQKTHLITTIKHHSRFLLAIASDESKDGGFLRALDLHLEKNVYDVKNIPYYERHVKSLNPTARRALDTALFNLSIDRHKQNRQEWLDSHRYDDLTLFRQAYIQMISRIRAPSFKDPSQAKIFYTHLHQYASGPPTAEPDTWAEQELPYLLPLIPEVLRLVQDTQRP